jgi:uncharacterized membrane protein YeaQ/YmgE (transglycosylase-associated protein family)
MEYFYIIFVGFVAGWLAGVLFKSRGFGIGVDIIVGILGAFVGSILYSSLGLGTAGTAEQIGMALLGAFVLLVLVKMVPKQGKRL